MYIEGLDELDNRILNIIKDNARLSYKEIGEQVGISRVSVKNRMDGMQEKGIIKGYKAEIDSKNLPEGIRFVMDVETTPDYFLEMIEYLGYNSMIHQIYTVSGECRIHAEGYAPNKNQLEFFSRQIYGSTRGVRKLSLHTIVAVWKDVEGGVRYEGQYEKNKRSEHLEGRTGQ